MEEDNSCRFGTVCVTGGTGFLASWLISKLLEHGYTVNTTIRSSPDREKDVSYLTNLPGASERLRIFNADLDKPDSFDSAIERCVGVFHVAHPMDAFLGKETEEQITRKAINGTLGILQSCLKAKTVKRVVYTSSASALGFASEDLDMVDERIWSDIDRLRGFNTMFGIYSITKTLTEKAVLEFAEQNGLDIVTVIPTFITGPFLCPKLPGSVRATMFMVFGEKDEYNLWTFPMVHVDDLARAHIFLFQHPEAKGRYICSAVDVTKEEMAEFLSARYSQYQIPSPGSLSDIETIKYPTPRSKKLLDTGFKYRCGIEEIYDEAIKCCKEKGFL